MLPLLVVCCVALPALELWVLWQVAGLVGWPLALAALVAASAVGVVALRARGVVALRRLRTALRQNRVPGDALVDEALDEAGASALALPGFVSAAVGGVLLVPPTRAVAGRLAGWWLRRRADAGRAPRSQPTPQVPGAVPAPATAPEQLPGDDALLEAFVGGSDDVVGASPGTRAYGGGTVSDGDDVTVAAGSDVYDELARGDDEDTAADAWASFGTDRPWESEPRRFGRRRRGGRDPGDEGGRPDASGTTTGA